MPGAQGVETDEGCDNEVGTRGWVGPKGGNTQRLRQRVVGRRGGLDLRGEWEAGVEGGLGEGTWTDKMTANGGGAKANLTVPF